MNELDHPFAAATGIYCDVETRLHIIRTASAETLKAILALPAHELQKTVRLAAERRLRGLQAIRCCKCGARFSKDTWADEGVISMSANGGARHFACLACREQDHMWIIKHAAHHFRACPVPPAVNTPTQELK